MRDGQREVMADYHLACSYQWVLQLTQGKPV